VWTDLTKDWPSARSPQWLHFKWSSLKKVVQTCWEECSFTETVEILRKLYHTSFMKFHDQPKQFFKLLHDKYGIVKSDNKQMKAIDRFTMAMNIASLDTSANSLMVSSSDEVNKSSYTEVVNDQNQSSTSSTSSPILLNTSNENILLQEVPGESTLQLDNLNSLVRLTSS